MENCKRKYQSGRINHPCIWHDSQAYFRWLDSKKNKSLIHETTCWIISLGVVLLTIYCIFN